MAEIEDRPTKFDGVEVKFEVEEGKFEKRPGADLDEILQAIVWDLRLKNNWRTTAEAARKLGIPQSTLAELMDKKKTGVRLETVSRICAGLKQSPIDLFRRHERYAEDADFAVDFVFDRFRTVLDAGEASRLLPLLEVVKRKGALEGLLSAAEKIIPAPKARRKKRGASKS